MAYLSCSLLTVRVVSYPGSVVMVIDSHCKSGIESFTGSSSLIVVGVQINVVSFDNTCFLVGLALVLACHARPVWALINWGRRWLCLL